MGHILKSYDEDLKHLKELMLQMMNINLKQLNLLHVLFSDFTQDIQSKTFEIDTDLNKLDAEIINEALRLLNLRSPVASDLRFVFSSSHISRILERTGDQVKSIAKYTVSSYIDHDNNSSLKVKYLETIHILIEMMHLAIEAFDKMDVSLSKKVQQMDDKIDFLYAQLSDLIVETKRDNLETKYHLLVIRNLERIGDHIHMLCRYIDFVENNEVLYR